MISTSIFDESLQRNSVRVVATAAWGRGAPRRSASLLLLLLVLLFPLLGPCPLLLLLLTAATMLAKSSSNSTKGCSCNCSLTSSTRTTWPMIRWNLWQSKWKVHQYWKEPDMPSAAAAVFPLSPRFPLLDSWFLCVVFFPRPIEKLWTGSENSDKKGSYQGCLNFLDKMVFLSTSSLILPRISSCAWNALLDNLFWSAFSSILSFLYISPL